MKDKRIFFNNFKFQKGTYTYNLFRCLEFIFGKSGFEDSNGGLYIKPRLQSTTEYMKTSDGFFEKQTFFTLESFLTHKETMLKNFVSNFVKKFSLIKIPFPVLSLPSGLQIKPFPIGYVFAIAYETIGGYAGAAPQNTTASFTMTVSGSNPFLILGQNVQDSTPSSIYWDSAGVNEALTQLYSLAAGSVGFYGTNYIFYKTAPTAGASKNVALTFNANTFDRGTAACFSDVDQSSPLDATGYGGNNDNDTSNSFSPSVTSSNCWGWGWFVVDNISGNSQTQPSGYTKVSGAECPLIYSGSTLSTGSNTLTWGVASNQRNTQLFAAFKAVAAATSHIKSADGILYANIKSMSGVAIANVKSADSVTN